MVRVSKVQYHMQQIARHFGDESFQTNNCISTGYKTHYNEAESMTNTVQKHNLKRRPTASTPCFRKKNPLILLAIS